jgi:hypothetical protein
MGKSKISLTKEELVQAFQSWYNDYFEDTTKFVDYDTEGFAGDYAKDSTETLIKYIDKVQSDVQIIVQTNVQESN